MNARIDPGEGHVQAACAGHILVVVGMEDERAIAAGEGVEVVVGSANASVLRERLARVDASRLASVYSFGVAGALDTALLPGALLLASRVVEQGDDAQRAGMAHAWPADVHLRAAVQAQARRANIGALREAVFLGTDIEARNNPQANSAHLGEQYGAQSIDNESHIVAAFAARHALPFACVRAVSDALGSRLPPAALLALTAQGRPDKTAIARSLARHPLQLPALLRTARDYRKALCSLAAFRRSVGFVSLMDGR